MLGLISLIAFHRMSKMRDVSCNLNQQTSIKSHQGTHGSVGVSVPGNTGTPEFLVIAYGSCLLQREVFKMIADIVHGDNASAISKV